MRKIESDEAIQKAFKVTVYAEDDTADMWCLHVGDDGELCAYGRNVDLDDGALERAVRNALLAHVKQGHGGGKMRKARSAS